MNPNGQSRRKASSHERIVKAAARAIRRGGFAGVGVVDIMKEAGMTHGGFYAHFASRDALLAEALDHAAAQRAASMARSAADVRLGGSSVLHTLVISYLSDRHVKACESGCPVSALASEMPRQAPEVRDAAARSVRSLLMSVQEALPPGAGPGAAVAIASQLVGALQLARAFGGNEEAKALLAAVRDDLLARYDRPGLQQEAAP